MAKKEETKEVFKINRERLKDFQYWIVERENIRRNKEAGKTAPWTKDDRMATTRWCNVRRMDDKVSRWLMDNWYTNTKLKAKDLIVAAATARIFNKPETLEVLCPDGFKSFDYNGWCKKLKNIQDDGGKIFTGVYIINGAGANGRRKWLYVMDNLKKIHETLEDDKIDTTSMEKLHAYLMKFPGLGSFIAGQMVADLRWVIGPKLKSNWQDRMTWAPQGPGSTAGLNVLFDTIGAHTNGKRFASMFEIYVKEVQKSAKVAAVAKDRGLEAHDWQNTLCEGSKWARVLTGGRSKNRYKAPQQKQLGLFRD